MHLAPLRPFDRVVAGYATVAFAIAAGESVVMHEWVIAMFGIALAAAGVALLVHDHRRWRADRRVASQDATSEGRAG